MKIVGMMGGELSLACEYKFHSIFVKKKKTIWMMKNVWSREKWGEKGSVRDVSDNSDDDENKNFLTIRYLFT